jgi:hypothetical protein
MAGDYPSNDFAITEDGVVRRVVHLPSGMTIATTRAPRDPLAVSSRYTIETEGSGAHYPQEIDCPGGAAASSRLGDAQVWTRVAPRLTEGLGRAHKIAISAAVP